MIINYSNQSLFGKDTNFPFLIQEANLTEGFHLHSHDFSEFKKDKLFKFAELAVFIEQNYNKTITINELSQKIGLSERHFSRIFRSIYGNSPMDYIMKLRLKYSCILLRSRDFNITDAAIKCGFEDSNYFTRQFKKYYGVTPSQYKRGGI